MYPVDDQDVVVPFSGLPDHSAGAPMPMVLATDNDLVLGYETAPDGEHIAVVKFIHSHAHYFGSPNDEALHGHPLANRGLASYGIYEVQNSSWIRRLEHMNRVHPSHRADRFARLKHFVFTFHDNTFECIAEGVALVATEPNTSTTSAAMLARHVG